MCNFVHKLAQRQIEEDKPRLSLVEIITISVQNETTQASIWTIPFRHMHTVHACSAMANGHGECGNTSIADR